ncbi:TPA: hypothetical protein ACRU8F_001269 [Staphylococcus aureus]
MLQCNYISGNQFGYAEELLAFSSKRLTAYLNHPYKLMGGCFN